MKNIISFLLTAAVATSFIPTVMAEKAPAAHELYVSVSGSDENEGTISSPFKTIDRAREEVRKLNDDMKGDIDVYIREGIYRQTEALVFNEEDSGTNGYYVNYKAYPNEKAVISGGIEVTGWKKHKGNIWSAPVSGIEYAQQLYVNGRRARRAQSEDYIDVEAFFKLPASEEAADGIVNHDLKYSKYKNQSDIQLHFARGWRSYTINVEKITASSDGSRFLLRQPSLKAAMGLISTVSHSVDVGHNFILENAFEELDTEGEFYYDRSEKQIYYIPRADEDMNTAAVELAVLDRLVTIAGASSAEKVSNITFDSLDFAHATWTRRSKFGHIGDQAQDMLPEEGEPMIEPGFTMVPANIHIDRAEKINFINNNIYDLGCVGIGLYYGVKNCKFEGNAFYDIDDSAMTIGTADNAYEDIATDGTNVAGGKEASASSYGLYAGPQVALDGNKKTMFDPVGMPPHWWQVDLGKAYTIDRVEIDDRVDSPSIDSMRSNFDVLASNDPEFNDYVIIAKLGPTPFEAGGTAVLKSKSTQKFRYVRLRKADYFVLPEIRVITKDIETVPGVDLCKFNSITNNVITRVGLQNYGAPGIQAYYVQGMDISHNHIYEVPYTGIAEGWGWINYPDAFFCRDNRLNYNLIEDNMQVAFDGGGIYMLGNQPNTTEIGNYIKNQHNNLAGLYLDSGSERITLKNNVIETAPFMFSSAGQSYNNLWKDNWMIGTHSVINLNENCLIDNNAVIIPGNAPLEAVKVMRNAGVEDRFEGLEERAGKNWWPVSREALTNNAKKEILPGLMGDSTFVGQYLTYFIHSAQEWIKMAEVGDGLCQYPQEAIDKLNVAIDEANKVVQKDPVVRDDILAARWKLFDAFDEFENSRNTYPTPELIKLAEDELKGAVVGKYEGMSAAADLQIVKDAIAEARKKPQDTLTRQYLEQSIINLRENKVNLNISNVSMPDQTASAVIDREKCIVEVPVKHMTDLTSIIPSVVVNKQVKITPESNTPQDFTNGVVYTVSNQDGTATKNWTVFAKKPEPVNSDTPYSIASAIADKDNWNMFTSMNCSNYSGEIYGDIELVFDMEIASREQSYPGFVFRTQDPDKDFTQTGNSTYILIFTPGQIEFYRFNDGIRTQFYGPVQNVTTIFGPAIQTDAFKLGTGEKNRMEVTAKNEGDGVRLKLVINGQEIYNFVDNYEGAITEAGYIGTVSPDSPVVLTAAE